MHDDRPGGAVAALPGSEPRLRAKTRPAPGWPAGERLFRMLVILGIPLRWWVRLEVHGAEQLRGPGAILLVSNHDSSLEPLALADTGMRNGRPVRFLAKASLWRPWPLGRMLDAIGQIPIRRGVGDVAAMEAAVEALRVGEVVAVFPEGTFSRGRALRARRGVARLAEAAPGARIVLAAVSGGTDLARFPRRPRVVVELFAPSDGQRSPHEEHAALANRLLAEIRTRVPPVPAGRGGATRTAEGAVGSTSRSR